MEEEINRVADSALEQPGITGYLCVDKDGLCIAARGQVNQSMSGIVQQIANLASKIEGPNQREPENSEPPVIRVDLERYKMIIQSRDSFATALISQRK